MNIGDKVVCVDDSACLRCGHKLSITLNSVYVILSSGRNSVGYWVNLIGVPLCHCQDRYIGPEQTGYRQSRFRLLDELKKENKFHLSTTTIKENEKQKVNIYVKRN